MLLSNSVLFTVVIFEILQEHSRNKSLSITNLDLSQTNTQNLGIGPAYYFRPMKNKFLNHASLTF